MFDYRTFLSYPLGIYTGYYVDNARRNELTLSYIVTNFPKCFKNSFSIFSENGKTFFYACFSI
jgi:hypothetical protein